MISVNFEWEIKNEFLQVSKQFSGGITDIIITFLRQGNDLENQALTSVEI